MPIVIDEIQTDIEAPTDTSRGIGGDAEAPAATTPDPAELEQAMRRQAERAARLRAH